MGVRGSLLKWIKSYVSGRKQRVVLDGQMSDRRDIKAGVPQGSALKPLLFLIYINDITISYFCMPMISRCSRWSMTLWNQL